MAPDPKVPFFRYRRRLQGKLPRIKFAIDVALWLLAVPLAFWVRVEQAWIIYLPAIGFLSLVGLPIKALMLHRFGLHQRSWHAVGFRDVFALVAAIGTVTLLLWVLVLVGVPGFRIPRSVPLVEGMLAVFFLSTARLAVRFWYERSGLSGAPRAKRVLIVGAGEAGTMIAREMLRNPRAGRIPVGFLDDDPVKQRQRFLGIRVLGKIPDLPRLASEHGVDEVLIAMPSEPGRVVRNVVELANEAEIEHRIIPGIYDLLSGRVSISQIRDVDVEDLLRREPVHLELPEIEEFLSGKTILVTGAGGSIGSEIVRQIARFKPGHVILLGRGENSLFSIETELARTQPELSFRACIADLRDYPTLEHVFRTYEPDVVFHAAAHKHVPMMEANPEQAIFNNVVGTKNIVDLSIEHGVKRFVNISTDKAVNPTSIMGGSKRVAELVVYEASHRCAADQIFVSVRFGNVLGSSGSVIPIFKEQIRRGGPVTVTHPDMKRYFMTIPEASQLVLQAGSMNDNGRVYVLDMGEPVAISDLARDLIMLSGLRPGEDIEIEYTGIRPGEKLFEEIMTVAEGVEASWHENIFVSKKNGLPREQFHRLLERLVAAAEAYDEAAIRRVLIELIPNHQFKMDASLNGAAEIASENAAHATAKGPAHAAANGPAHAAANGPSDKHSTPPANGAVSRIHAVEAHHDAPQK